VTAPLHEIAIKPYSTSTPPVLRAYCTCAWAGPPRMGRNARAIALADGREHCERAAKPA
jgi:hypothetical protein